MQQDTDMADALFDHFDHDFRTSLEAILDPREEDIQLMHELGIDFDQHFLTMNQVRDIYEEGSSLTVLEPAYRFPCEDNYTRIIDLTIRDCLFYDDSQAIPDPSLEFPRRFARFFNERPSQSMTGDEFAVTTTCSGYTMETSDSVVRRVVVTPVFAHSFERFVEARRQLLPSLPIFSSAYTKGFIGGEEGTTRQPCLPFKINQ